jgi:TDG/mug DNA glycosylase family protein
MLDDMLKNGLDLVICGTAASSKSARVGHYYAGPGNKFWRTLHETGLTGRELAPGEYRQVLEYGIGLTDLVKEQAGSDASILFREPAKAVLRTKIVHYQPRVLCFNGKRAAQEYFGVKSIRYGNQAALIGRTALFVAPSTSGAANGQWDLDIWRELERMVRGARTGG